MSTPLFVAILALSAVVSSFVSGILGMAGGMILMGVLLAMMPVPAAMMLHGITQLASNAWRAFLWRKAVDWRVFRQYLYGALAAVAAFALLKFVASKPVAFIVLGLTPFVSLVLPEKLHLNVERRGHSFSCGDDLHGALAHGRASRARSWTSSSCARRWAARPWSRPRR